MFQTCMSKRICKVVNTIVLFFLSILSTSQASNVSAGEVAHGNILYGVGYASEADAAPVFADVPESHWAWEWIETLYRNGVTAGCSTNPPMYCPEDAVTRAQMAVFLERGVHGSTYQPPEVGSSTGFNDVSTGYWAAAWIKQLASDGITIGCGVGNYCPEDPVTRAQMAIFLLRAKNGTAYTPPVVGASTGFNDVFIDDWAAAWIKQLAAEGITSGCGNGNYCPEDPVTRAQMAVFLVRTFDLPTGLVIDYEVTVMNYQTVDLIITISNIITQELTLHRLAYPEPNSLPVASQIAVRDEEGGALPYSIDNWQSGSNRLEIITINTTDVPKVIFSYRLDLRAQANWQVTPQFIAVSENQIFFQTDPDIFEISKMHMDFSIPQSWRVVTRFTPNESGYSVNVNDTFRTVIDNQWQRFFFASPIVLGEFEVIETRFNDVRVLGAYPTGNTQLALDASYVDDIFAYQVNLLGSPSINEGDFALIYVFGPHVPESQGGGIIDTFPNHGTFEESHVTDDRHLGHEMFHAWFGDGHFLPDAFRFMRVPPWFSEGANEYFGVEAHLDTGAFTLAMADQWHNMFYQDYLGAVGTPDNVPVSNCYDLEFRSSPWYICLYSKSHTVIQLLDETLKHYTEQEFGLGSMVKLMFDKYSYNPVKQVNETELKTAASEISGYDFTPFFDAYVTGNDLLPLEIRNGHLEVIWENLPELTAYVPPPAPTLPITIDGYNADWQDYPFITDTVGDSIRNDVDITGYSYAQDANYLDILIETKDPITNNPATFDINLIFNGSYEFEMNVNSDGSVWAGQYPGPWNSYASILVGWEDVIEIQIPKNIFEGNEFLNIEFLSLFTDVDGTWTWVDIVP